MPQKKGLFRHCVDGQIESNAGLALIGFYASSDFVSAKGHHKSGTGMRVQVDDGAGGRRNAQIVADSAA